MKPDTYLTKLEKNYSMDFPPEITQPPDGVTEFLNLTVMRLLLGKDITSLKQWLGKYRQRAPLSDRPVAEFFRLTRLAAVEELYGESGKVNAQKACELLPVVSEQYLFDTDTALVNQKALSLSMILENSHAIHQWREKRLEMPVFEGWEASAFEVLYLSSDLIQTDKFESLTAAFARISLRTISVQAQDSIAPLVLSLAAQCHKRGENLAAALKGRILELEKDVFLEGFPKIVIENQRLKYSRAGSKPILQIVALALGNGDLSTGGYEIEPFTTKLAPTLIAEYERREKKPAVQEVFCSENGLIECYLKLDEGVEMTGDEISNLQLRMKVGFEWASHLAKDIKAEIALRVE